MTKKGHLNILEVNRYSEIWIDGLFRNLQNRLTPLVRADFYGNLYGRMCLPLNDTVGCLQARWACNKSSYPHINVLLQSFASLPVPTATHKRTFSAMTILKT